MNRVLVLGLMVACTGALADTPRVADFALLDHTGRFHQLSYYSDQKAVVLVAHSQAAGLTPPDGVANADGVEFFFLNAMPTDSRESLAGALGSGTVPVLVDESQLVAESLGLKQVGDALVIDPAHMTLLYRGNIGGLETVVPRILDGEPVAAGPAGAGPAIPYPARGQQVSYTEDIVPILRENCVACHHDGGIGPWAMSNHAMIKGWSAMMREVVLTRRMPPGQIDPHVGKPLREVAGLTNGEQQKLIHWIDAGAPRDGERDPLAELTFPNPRFTLGEPDLVYRIPPQAIPATGVLDYRYVPVPLNLDRDVWVRAMEFVPGDRQVLHHVIAYVSSPADRTVRGRQTGAARGESIGGFAPGRQPDQFRDNSGRLIRKGSNLLLQMHYTTSGRETVDETEIGIYLHDEPPAYVMSGGVAGERRFLVPPYEKEYKLEGVQEINRDAYLYELNPHMHFRGRYMSFSAEYPDGSSEVLLSVPRYDFNWQFNYALKEPLFLPAGTRIVARGAMDNSAQNRSNPDPTVPVHFGLQTRHEMFFGFTTLRYVGDTPGMLAGEPEDEGAAPGAE